jgi:hypothetical protein
VIRRSATHLVGPILLGLATAVATLLVIFGATLALRGPAYYEWGAGPSFGISLGLTVVAYGLGAVLLVAITWLCQRIGLAVQPDFPILGAVLVLATWTLTEFPLVAELRARVTPSAEGWILGAFVATVVALVSNLVRGKLRAHKA